MKHFLLITFMVFIVYSICANTSNKGSGVIHDKIIIGKDFEDRKVERELAESIAKESRMIEIIADIEKNRIEYIETDSKELKEIIQWHIMSLLSREKVENKDLTQAQQDFIYLLKHSK